MQLHGVILPGYEDSWSRVLVSLEDVTDSVQSRRRLALSEAYARGLFEHSPVSLWVEDFSGVKALLDRVRMQGIQDFRVFTDVHPEFVDQCASEIRVLEVNHQTLHLFGSGEKAAIIRRLDEVFREEMLQALREQLIDLWDGKLSSSARSPPIRWRARSSICSSSFRSFPAMRPTGRRCRSPLWTSPPARRPKPISNISASTTCSPGSTTAPSMWKS